MKIAGGAYIELCEMPYWRGLFGSGGRAAAAVALLSPGVELHTYCTQALVGQLTTEMAHCGVKVIPTLSKESIAFAYFHPLSTPHIEPPFQLIPREKPLMVHGDAVLRFGFLEGDAIVHADRAVYDPQTTQTPQPFHANGSTARELAIVLNEMELCEMASNSDIGEAARLVMNMNNTDILVVKAGVRGATIFQLNHPTTNIPAYKSGRVFKIGTGDVFSATFALYWAERGLPAAEAADLASQAVATYADTKTLPINPIYSERIDLRPVPTGAPGPICLSTSSETMGQRWVREEARWCLKMLGAKVRDELHDETGASACASMLVIVDRGYDDTLSSIALARSSGVPVVALAEAATHEVTETLRMKGVYVANDISTAAYRAIWAAMEPRVDGAI